MEKDKIFFGEGGITDTEANRVADFAKLAYTDSENYLNNVSFISKQVETIDGDLPKDLSFGLTDLGKIEESIEKIGKLKALCAWLREAIKAHQDLINQAKTYSFEKYCEDNNIELPACPTLERELTEDDVIGTFDVKKRNRYYSLEAQAATIGQFIHKNGAVDRARKEYYDKVNNPRSITGEGKNTLIYSYHPTVEANKIEELFYSLQQKHATYQRELNSIKSEVKSRITNDSIEKNKAYEVAFKNYHTVEIEYYNQYTTWKAQETKRVAALKIIIPNSLKEVFEEVNSHGKNNK
jgi:hypothetical protein